MACIKTTSKGMKVTIPDPTETPNAHGQPPILFLVGAGIQFMLLFVLIFKALQRKKILSDLLHILFFFFGSAGYGLYGVATLMMAVEPVGSSKLTTIISRLFMVASWACLLLNCCCLMESIAMPVMGRLKLSQTSMRIIFQVFSLLLIFAAFVGAAISRDHLLSTLALLSIMSGTCAVSFLRAAYVDHVNKSLAGRNMMKSLGTSFGCVAHLVAAILEPICGYAGHLNCYEGCEIPGFHSLLLVILLLGTWFLVGLGQSCSPDDGAIPTFRISQPPVVQAVAPSSVGST